MKAARVLAVMVACALGTFMTATPAVAGSSLPPPGYRLIDVKRAGLHIAIPERWTTVDMTRAERTKVARSVAGANPDLPRELLLGAADDNSVVLRAFQRGTTGTELYGVGVQFSPGDDDLDSVGRIRAEVNGLDFFQDVHVNRARVAGHPALHLHVTMTVRYSTDTPMLDLNEDLYEVLGRTGVYNVVFVTTDPESMAPVMRTSLSTLRLTR